MKVHFTRSGGNGKIAVCGGYRSERAWPWNLTYVHSHVTCKNCLHKIEVAARKGEPV